MKYTEDIARAGAFDPEDALAALDLNYSQERTPNGLRPMAYERILDAHYAQAEKADEARIGAVLVRQIDEAQPADFPTAGPEESAQLTKYARQERRARAARDFDDPDVPHYSVYVMAGLLMPPTSATEQTEEN